MFLRLSKSFEWHLLNNCFYLMWRCYLEIFPPIKYITLLLLLLQFLLFLLLLLLLLLFYISILTSCNSAFLWRQLVLLLGDNKAIIVKISTWSQICLILFGSRHFQVFVENFMSYCNAPGGLCVFSSIYLRRGVSQWLMSKYAASVICSLAN